MSWPMFAAAVPAGLLAFRLATDFIPMMPLNDITKKSSKTRKRDLLLHYIPLAAAAVLGLTESRPAALFAFIISITYLAVQFLSWWLPYLRGASDSFISRREREYGRTHRLLPQVKNHPIPNTVHTVIAFLALLFVVSAAGNLVSSAGSGTANSSVSAQAAETEAADQNRIEYAFTQAGQKPDLMLIEAFNSAQATIDIAIGAINKDEIVQAIIAARIRDVKIRVITDRSESSNKTQSEVLKKLITAGIPVLQNSQKGIMDLKLAIIDGKTVATGSFNYTVNASTINDEVLMIIRDPELAGEWQQQFNAMWTDANHFRPLSSGGAG